jgi:hypothetical protein
MTAIRNSVPHEPWLFGTARRRACESFRLPHDPPGICRPPGTRDSEIQEAPRSDS